MDDAVQTVMTQCELWTDNSDAENGDFREKIQYFNNEPEMAKVAENPVSYGKKEYE
jgi:type I restriction enzyme R subunit